MRVLVAAVALLITIAVQARSARAQSDPSLNAAIGSYLVSHGYRYLGDCPQTYPIVPSYGRICSVVRYPADGTATVLLGLPYSTSHWTVVFSQTDYGWVLVYDPGEWTIGGDTLRTVLSFYDDIGERDFADAYSYLSPAMQAASPYASFVAGYVNTISFCAKAYTARNSTVVVVGISSVDRGYYGPVRQNFFGTWSLVWSDDAQRWLLDMPIIDRTDLSFC